MIVTLSDIAAMAASPRYALCSLTLSERVDAAWAMELFGGIRDACDEHALWLVGGDLTRGSEISIAVTAVGEVAPGRAVTRSGATPGDVIVVTGSLGGAAAGRRIVEGSDPRGLRPAERDAVGRFVRPAARIGEAALLAAGYLTAMIDLSDGLTMDLARVCEASGVGAEIRLASLPIHDTATREDALGGGEDYELLATVGPESSEATIAAVRDTFGIEVTRIGVITELPGLTGIGEDGSPRSLPATGWDPFV